MATLRGLAATTGNFAGYEFTKEKLEAFARQINEEAIAGLPVGINEDHNDSVVRGFISRAWVEKVTDLDCYGLYIEGQVDDEGLSMEGMGSQRLL